MDDDKRKACQRVLYTLRNPLMLMSIEDRAAAVDAARTHNITAEDLLVIARDNAKNA